MNSKKIREVLGGLIRKDATIYNNKHKTMRTIKVVFVNPKKVDKIRSKLLALGATDVQAKRQKVWAPTLEDCAYYIDILAHFPLEGK